MPRPFLGPRTLEALCMFGSSSSEHCGRRYHRAVANIPRLTYSMLALTSIVLLRDRLHLNGRGQMERSPFSAAVAHIPQLTDSMLLGQGNAA
eukprot:2109454-Alexandrium_andersonii.AAC.1